MVPNILYDTYLELGRWVSTQRSTNGQLFKKQIADLLVAIGFVWDTSEARWMENYERLVEYEKDPGDTSLVPQRYDKDPELGTLVKNQRSSKGKLLS